MKNSYPYDTFYFCDQSMQMHMHTTLIFMMCANLLKYAERMLIEYNMLHTRTTR